jgi:hypothetical protein
MSTYTVIGPDGTPSAPVDLQTLQTWASLGQLPPTAPVILPEGIQTTAGQIPELGPALQHASGVPYAYQKPAGSKMIPTGNPAALWGYYSGILAIVPCVGLLAGPVAIICSIAGLRAYRRDPKIFGVAHCIVGLVTGTLGLAIGMFLLIAFIKTSS